MSANSRLLEPGALATSNFNGVGSHSLHTIIARKDDKNAASGVMFQVKPLLLNTQYGDWVDADWFEPAAL